MNNEFTPIPFSLLKQLAGEIYKHNASLLEGKECTSHYWGDVRPDKKRVELDIVWSLIDAANAEKNEHAAAEVEAFKNHFLATGDFNLAFVCHIDLTFQDKIARALIGCLEHWGWQMDRFPGFCTSISTLRNLELVYNQRMRWDNREIDFVEIVHSATIGADLATEWDINHVIAYICMFCNNHGIDLKYFLELRMRYMEIDWPREKTDQDAV